jgi:hypothetical protein
MDDPNRRHHIFGEPKHNLDPLIRRYGSEEAAAQAIVEAVTTVFESGGLTIDDHGLYEQVFDVDGNSVTVRGRVVDGMARVATAWIPL